MTKTNPPHESTPALIISIDTHSRSWDYWEGELISWGRVTLNRSGECIEIIPIPLKDDDLQWERRAAWVIAAYGFDVISEWRGKEWVEEATVTPNDE